MNLLLGPFLTDFLSKHLLGKREKAKFRRIVLSCIIKSHFPRKASVQLAFSCLKAKIISTNKGENASNKMEASVCADGDKNTAVFLFLSATLVLHMLPKLAPCV